tara:strand:- start:83 stop:190 length:108 start_codon:yes stop_codon:yes gene_type:complete
MGKLYERRIWMALLILKLLKIEKFGIETFEKNRSK